MLLAVEGVHCPSGPDCSAGGGVSLGERSTCFASACRDDSAECDASIAAEKRVFDIIGAIARHAAMQSPGEPMSTDSLMTAIDNAVGEEVPTYQTYVTLGWLKQTGLAGGERRGGLTLSGAESLVADAQRAWEGVVRARK